jgi:hypothetical protein
MQKVFRCGCAGHLLEIVYDSEFDCMDLAIFEVYNEKGDRKLKKPKCIADVVIEDYSFAEKDLTELFKFVSKASKKRDLKSLPKATYFSKGRIEKNLDSAIKTLTEEHKKHVARDKKRRNKNKGK